jgi:predicted nucleotidyltransferase
MNKEDIFKELGIRKKILEEKGYKVIYIGLYGSQNYNLDDEESDIDVKAIILPSLQDIIFRKVTSKTIECENGNIDVKDLITFYDVIKKGNFSYIEAIDTEYSIGDKYIKELFKQFRPNLKSILGAMYEKRKALTHEFPSKKAEFEKWGFDPKQHHHILRLYDLLSYNLQHNELRSYLVYEDYSQEQMELMGYKRNKNNIAKTIIEENSDEFINRARELVDYNYHYEVINIDEEINKYIEDKLKIEITRNSKTMSAREIRTFDNPIPKKDIEKFPILEEYKGQDISYIVYESIEIL